MSGRYHSYDKGSSRSTRDDSRPSKDRERFREKSRSRSPVHHSQRSRDRSERSSSSRDYEKRREYEDKYDSKPRYQEPEDVPAPPPPPRITKISIGFNKPNNAPIKMNLGGTAKVAPKPTIASVFNAEDDDEPEEMPAEARMRMRNIGRETPTSAGPNSFGKTKQGFCDAKKVFEKNLKSALDMADNKPTLSKLPQTIYKIKP